MNAISPHVIAVALLASILSAQSPAQAQALTNLRVPIHTAEADNGVEYGTWAAGDAYKASFHDGMTFVPYLGTEYPHNQPWSWRTTSVRVGATELLENGELPVHHQQEFRYEYRFGAVTETYDVRTEGLEQAFVVPQRPAVGDLVIRGVITSLMHSPNVESAHQSLIFFDDAGRTIVGYGEAHALDAHGDCIPITTAFQDGEVTLTVPASWLGQATFPVTVDPLLTRSPVSPSNSMTLRSVDIGRDGEAAIASVLIVHVFAASQFDDDIRATLCSDDYAPRSLVFYDVTSSWDSDGACCAFVGGGDKWAIVWRRYFPTGIRRSLIRCRVHPSGSLTPSTAANGLPTPAGYNDWRPDVGGVKAFATGSEAMVVFQREDNTNTVGHYAGTSTSDVLGVLLDVTPINGSFGATFPIKVSPVDHERPSINQAAQGGVSFSWVVAAQSFYLPSGTPWRTQVVRVNNSGILSFYGWGTGFGQTNTHHALGPKVDGQSGRYAVTYAVTDLATTPGNGSIRGKGLYVERFRWDHGSPGPGAGYPPVLLQSDANKVFEATGISFDTDDYSHFAVGFRTLPPLAYSAQCVRVGYTGAITEGPLVMYSTGGHTTTGVACTFDHDNANFLCAYGVSGPSQGDMVYGHTLEYPSVVHWSTTSPGCTQAQISWFGNQQIGSEFNSVGVWNATSTSGHFLLASFGTANQPIVHPAVLSGCHLLVDNGAGFLGTLNFQIGASVNWRFALPEWLTPFTLHFQDWVLDGSQFSSTERLSVPVTR